jgi:hypothetical protein
MSSTGEIRTHFGDDDPMPFGAHKGTPLGELPASYLLWLGDQDWIDEWPMLSGYIEWCRDELEKEVAGE